MNLKPDILNLSVMLYQKATLSPFFIELCQSCSALRHCTYEWKKGNITTRKIFYYSCYYCLLNISVTFVLNIIISLPLSTYSCYISVLLASLQTCLLTPTHVHSSSIHARYHRKTTLLGFFNQPDIYRVTNTANIHHCSFLSNTVDSL